MNIYCWSNDDIKHYWFEENEKRFGVCKVTGGDYHYYEGPVEYKPDRTEIVEYIPIDFGVHFTAKDIVMLKQAGIKFV